MNKQWYWALGVLAGVGLIVGGLYLFGPHEAANIYPHAISAFCYIDNLTPGMNLLSQLKLENPSFTDSASISIKFSRPIENYEQTEKYVGDKAVPVDSVIYEPAPTNFKEWVTLEQDEVFLPPRGRKTIYLRIAPPIGVILPAKWQFLMTAKDENQGGQFVQTQNVCRCLVTMREQ